MYDPLVVDTFLLEHAGGELDASSARDGRPVAATALFSVRRTPPTANEGLEDIASSSEEMLALFELTKELSGRASTTDVAEITLHHLRRMIPASLLAAYLIERNSGELICALRWANIPTFYEAYVSL